ncbi:protein ELYS isoform X3 [Aethina tumida]|uniref:protein ELYS isoform X3 n=1 Tax=Aethina tumida TaxID=116153 RepID=UPI00214821F5|nr:protein ELYS isoform X3 [Aethina tumida]
MSYSLAKVVNFSKSALQTFTNVDQIGNVEGNIAKNQRVTDVKGLLSELVTLGGVLLDTNFSWLAKGPCLEIRNNKNGRKIGAWTFGNIVRDSNTQIVCVDEIKKPRLPLLAVGINCDISGGLVCIFDVYGSKVIRSIQVSEKVTSLHVVDAGLDDLNLRGPLRNFDGILAVGTEHGNVYLIDICRQLCEEALQRINSVIRDELNPSQLVILNPQDVSRIEYYKELSVREGNHLAIHLNVVLNRKTEHFTLKGQRGDDKLYVNKEEVLTSSLFYCPQLTSLLVGYNFGAFQLWNLSELTLVYTSPVCDEHMPITHFCIQEPDNDPRAFCYIWVVYNRKDLSKDLPFAVMYSFSYDSKDYQEGYGNLYQDFQHCGIRFQIELGVVDDNKKSKKLKGGYCTGLESVQHKLNLHNFNDESDTSMALCLISWTINFEKEAQSYMLIFDLNQWYKEQMPATPKLTACSNYISRINLSNILSVQAPGPLINLRINQKTLSQFIGTQRLEEHFFPSSLTYDVVGVQERRAAHIHCHGLQKALLAHISQAGPITLLRPADIFQQILALGMFPLFEELPHSPATTNLQRDVVLDVCLEHQMVNWLCNVAKEWANGSFSAAGCSLDVLINWAFQRAVVLKSNADKYCATLFDYSETKLDHNTCTLLNVCTKQINNLCSFYNFLLAKVGNYLSNTEIVTEQYKCLQTVSVYFDVLQWLVNVGLLPECPPSTYPRPDQAEKISAPYPVEQLTDYYNKKRALRHKATEGMWTGSDSLLFVDNLIAHKCGAERLQKQWQDDGGSGLYPPPSLQSLLRTYLVEGSDIAHKHCLVIYVFLDMARTLEQERYDPVITRLIKFPAVFKVSNSLIKITEAFWQLDHGDYSTAMEQLLDPFVESSDLEHWHHIVVLRTLLLDNQHHLALLYMQIRKPSIVDEKDVFTAISLFIANNMLDEAFYFQKQHHNNNEERLLIHLFQECSKNEILRASLNRCLSNNEEKAFFNYLKQIRDPNMDDLQVFYFLLRSRFVEAFDIHQNSKRVRPECQGLVGQKNASRTDNIVKFFKSLLPDVSRNLVDVVRKERSNLWREVERPTPLSVFVHNVNEQVQYKSTVIHAALAKAKQTFNDLDVTVYKDLTTEETPFLRTPKAFPNYSRRQSSVINPTIIFDEEFTPTPSKRMRLSSRPPTSSPTKSLSPTVHSKMLTPLVKRKVSEGRRFSDKHEVATPQSILKNSILGISSRQSLNRTPSVRFDVANYSSSLNDSSQELDETSLRIDSKQKLDFIDNTTLHASVSSKDTTSSSDVFYSPDASVNESSKTDDSKRESIVTIDDSKLPIEVSHVEPPVPESEETRIIFPEEPLNVTSSPRGRRSYKRSLGETPPVRSSLRHQEPNDEGSSPLASESPITPVLADSPKIEITNNESPRVGRVRGRRSLSRQVLENNASKLLPTSEVSMKRSVTRETTTTVKERIDTAKSSETTEINTETLEKTEVRYRCMPSPRRSLINKSDVNNSYTTDSNASSPAGLTKYVYDGPELTASVLKCIFASKSNKLYHSSDANEETDLSNSGFDELEESVVNETVGDERDGNVSEMEGVNKDASMKDTAKSSETTEINTETLEKTEVRYRCMPSPRRSLINKSDVNNSYTTDSNASSPAGLTKYVYDGPELTASVLKCIFARKSNKLYHSSDANEETNLSNSGFDELEESVVNETVGDERDKNVSEMENANKDASMKDSDVSATSTTSNKSAFDFNKYVYEGPQLSDSIIKFINKPSQQDSNAKESSEDLYSGFSEDDEESNEHSRESKTQEDLSNKSNVKGSQPDTYSDSSNESKSSLSNSGSLSTLGWNKDKVNRAYLDASILKSDVNTPRKTAPSDNDVIEIDSSNDSKSEDEANPLNNAFENVDENSVDQTEPMDFEETHVNKTDVFNCGVIGDTAVNCAEGEDEANEGKELEVTNSQDSIDSSEPVDGNTTITVTAEVHEVSRPASRSRRKSSTDSVSERRITRRSSLLMNDNQNADTPSVLEEIREEEKVDEANDVGENTQVTQSPGRRRSSVAPRTPTRKSLRRASETNVDVDEPRTPTRRSLRSTSVDQIAQAQSRRRSLRSASVDERENVEPKMSVEDAEQTDKSPSKPIRRTRSASTNLESDVTKSPLRRNRRGLSVDHIDSPVTGIKTRLRRQSTDSVQSNVSEMSDVPSPPKRNRRASEDGSVSDPQSVRTTRSRSSSMSSIMSESDLSVRRSTRTRKPFKTDLPEISEEKAENTETGDKQSRKRGRKPKTSK